MTDGTDQGPREREDLPTAEEIAEEVYRVGSENDVTPSKVIVFGSYAVDEATSESDADVVVVSSEIDEDDFHARRYHWDWDWNHDQYPQLDLIVLRPDEFGDFKNRENHIVSTAVETGEEFNF